MTTANNEYKNSPVASSDNPIPENAAIPIIVAPSNGHCVRLIMYCAALIGLLPMATRSIIPSAITIALSTSMPMAMTIAPNEMRCNCIPINHMNNKVPITVTSNTAPTTTPERQPINKHNVSVTTATDITKFNKNPSTDSSTM